MTSIIIGLLAALGIGGGIALAGHGGGGGHNTPAVSGPEEPGNPTEENPAVHLNPDYNLISFLADDKQYPEVKAATEDTLSEEAQSLQTQVYQAVRKKDSFAKSQTQEPQKNNFIKDFLLRGGITEDGNFWALNLKPQNEAFELGKYENGKFSVVGTLSAINNANQSPYYDTYRLDDKNNPKAGEETGHVHYDVIHLGGAKSKLTVADFGRWESADLDTKIDENSAQLKIESGSNIMRTFFLYDERYAYKSNRRDEVKMQGNVLVAGPDTIGLGLSHLIFTGNIFMDLNLAKNRLTGSVKMNEVGLAGYDIDSFSGSILGSLVLFDSGEILGGIGKLLSGKNGLEMVGQLSRQTEDANIDYTFGAWEVSRQTGMQLAESAGKLNLNYDLITVLADKMQYKRVIVDIPIEQDKNAWIQDGTLKNRRSISVTEKDGIPALAILTGAPNVVEGKFTKLEIATPILMTKSDRSGGTAFYDYYHNTIENSGTWVSPAGEQERSFTQHDDLYLAGAKVGLTVADFGYWNEYRAFAGGESEKRYHDFIMYDTSFLYAGGRSGSVDFEGRTLMLLPQEEKAKDSPYEVYGGIFNMKLNLPQATLQGSIDMRSAMNTDLYNIDFTGDLKNGNKFSFAGDAINPLSYGSLLQGKDGLEAVGIIATMNEKGRDTASYAFGAKEVK